MYSNESNRLVQHEILLLFLALITGAVDGVLLLTLLFVVLVITVCCIWRRVVNIKKSPGEIHAPFDVSLEEVEILTQERKCKDNSTVPFKNSEPL